MLWCTKKKKQKYRFYTGNQNHVRIPYVTTAS